MLRVSINLKCYTSNPLDDALILFPKKEKNQWNLFSLLIVKYRQKYDQTKGMCWKGALGPNIVLPNNEASSFCNLKVSACFLKAIGTHYIDLRRRRYHQ